MGRMLGTFPWVTAGAEWIHILAGILWFGAALYNNSVVVPAVLSLPLSAQRAFGEAVDRRAPMTLRIAGTTTIVMGILRGTVVSAGRIKSFSVFQTRYGVLWIIALVAAIATFAWGEAVITPRLRRWGADDDAWVPGADGGPSEAYRKATKSLTGAVALELLGFIVIFTCMVGLNFS
ncbi:MAG: hypothetical protein ACXVQX_10070 [Actinomycetota bacterium]